MAESHSVYVRIYAGRQGVVRTREVAPGVMVDYLNGEVYGVEILNAWAVEVDGRDVLDVARRYWWWPVSELTNRRQLFLRGGDEFGNRTIGIRLPGGMLIVALNIPLRTEWLDPDLEEMQ